jgi:hypothetical protein
MRVYEDIERMLHKELENTTKKGELTAGALEVMYKAIDILKDIATIEAMENSGYSNEYSGDYAERMPYMYDDGYSREGHSYARGRGRYAKRDSMGRYSSEGYGMDGDNGYSGTNEAIAKLKSLLDNASPQEANAVQMVLNKLQAQ